MTVGGKIARDRLVFPHSRGLAAGVTCPPVLRFKLKLPYPSLFSRPPSPSSAADTGVPRRSPPTRSPSSYPSPPPAASSNHRPRAESRRSPCREGRQRRAALGAFPVSPARRGAPPPPRRPVPGAPAPGTTAGSRQGAAPGGGSPTAGAPNLHVGRAPVGEGGTPESPSLSAPLLLTPRPSCLRWETGLSRLWFPENAPADTKNGF